jgi:predicted outer membrane repeat protein
MSKALFASCFFERNNSGELGGAIYADTSKLTVEQSKFFNNSAHAAGGALLTFSPESEISDSIFTGNLSSFGGAIYCDSYDSALLVNCMVTGNISRVNGGGILFYSPAQVVNGTFSLNRAQRQGGAAWCGENAVEFRNCILWGNQAKSGNEIYTSSDAVSVAYSDIKGGFEGEGNIDQSPLFLARETTGDLHLQPGSPCINQISVNQPGVPETDLAGYPRPVDDDPYGEDFIIDMGAHEFRYGAYPILVPETTGDLLIPETTGDLLIPETSGDLLTPETSGS